MNSRGILFFLTLLLASVAYGQEIDPKISLDDLGIQASALDKKDLPAFAKKWLDLALAKDKEAADAAAEYGKDGANKKAISAKIIAIELERKSLVLRVEKIQQVLVAQGNTEEATRISNQLATIKTTHADATDPSVLLAKAKAWLTSPEGGIRLGLNLLMFFVIIFAAKILANVAAKVLTKMMRVSKLKISDLLHDFFINTTRKVIFFAGIVMALGRLGVDTAPLLAGIGVMGFVIGFALQGTLSNFASGVMILLYRPYDIGNVVSAAGATGKVTAMSLVSTTLTTPDNQIVIIPNSSIWGGVITNITGNSTRRVDLTFGIGYDDDIPKAMKVLEELATGHELVLKNPETVIQLHELADSSVNFVVRPWVKTADYWTVYWDLHRAVKERFDAEGISIPYPQQDVHVHQVSSPGE